MLPHIGNERLNTTVVFISKHAREPLWLTILSATMISLDFVIILPLVVPPARAITRTAPTLIFKVRRPLIMCSHCSLNRSIFPRGSVSLRCHANTPIREHCRRRHLLRTHRRRIPRTFRASGNCWFCVYSKSVLVASISIEQERNNLLKKIMSNFDNFLSFNPEQLH